MSHREALERLEPYMGKLVCTVLRGLGGSNTSRLPDELVVFVVEHAGQVQGYVQLKPFCDYLGLSWAGQLERTKRDPVLAAEIQFIRVTRMNARPGAPDAVCLPLDMLHGWLFGIQASRVKAELQEKVTRYRRECFRVLWQAFKGEVVPPGPPGTGLSGAALALEIATAVQHLARQQVEMEARLGQVAGQQTVMAEYMRGFVLDTRHRLTALERHLGSGPTISEAQAAEIVLAVKLVGQELERRGDKAGYQKVYSELYHRYAIATYRNLPVAHYTEVTAWLHAWYREITPPPTGGQGEGSTEA